MRRLFALLAFTLLGCAGSGPKTRRLDPALSKAQSRVDVTLGTPILYYSRSNGLFVGLDLSGTRLERDEEAMRAFYGDARDFGVLLRSPRPPPPEVDVFRGEVARTFRR